MTNFREFTLVAPDGAGKPTQLESYRLAASDEDFWAEAAHPRTMADKHGERFVGYLMRTMQHNAALTDPKDLAWFLASYVRDARLRVEAAELPALASIREALQDALGMKWLLAVYCGWVPAFCWAHGQSEVSVTALGASSGSEFVGALAEISGCHEAALRILSHCQFGG